MGHARTILVCVGNSSLLYMALVRRWDLSLGLHNCLRRNVFRWNWRRGQELSAKQSLRKAQGMEQRRKAIASAISGQIRPMMADLDIESKTHLLRAVLDTKIKMNDLIGDGVPAILAQGMVNCGATGNCPFWNLAERQDQLRNGASRVCSNLHDSRIRRKWTP